MPANTHTPGPWIVCNGGYRVVADHGPAEQICWTANNKFTRTPQARANARLIAAAPDLLAALERASKITKGGFTFCPACNYVSDAGHRADCYIAAALSKAKP